MVLVIMEVARAALDIMEAVEVVPVGGLVAAEEALVIMEVVEAGPDGSAVVEAAPVGFGGNKSGSS